MKTVVAFIKPHRFDDVMLALHKVDGLTGASASDVRGFGRDRPKKNDKTGEIEVSLDVSPHIRLEIACSDELVEKALTTIEGAAHTGLRGDGKIFVLPLEQAIRISSGERGEQAV